MVVLLNSVLILNVVLFSRLEMEAHVVHEESTSSLKNGSLIQGHDE